MTRIKEFRRRRNMKAVELARVLKISRAAVCYIERNGIQRARSRRPFRRSVWATCRHGCGLSRCLASAKNSAPESPA